MDRKQESYIDNKICKKYRIAEGDIIIKVAKMLKETKDYEYADYLLERGRFIKDAEELNMIIEELGGEDALEETFEDVIKEEYAHNAPLYRQLGKMPERFEDNAAIQQIYAACKQHAGDELKNITKSTGFFLPVKQNKEFVPTKRIWQDYLDKAIIQVLTGERSYNSVLYKVTSELSNSGLRTIDYTSGRHDRVDVAARRAVMTSLSQVTGEIQKNDAQKLGTNKYEVEWHAGARPSHMVWQGQIYTYDELKSVCGLGDMLGLLGINCYHTYYPYLEGYSERQYSDEWLKKQNEIESEKHVSDIDGKSYNLYESIQKQRKYEVSMRASREKIAALKAGDADKDTLLQAKIQYWKKRQDYKEFSKQMNLKEHMNRVYTGRTPGRLAPTKKELKKA